MDREEDEVIQNDYWQKETETDSESSQYFSCIAGIKSDTIFCCI